MKDMMKRYEEKHGEPLGPVLIAIGIVVGIGVTLFLVKSKSS